MLSIVYGMPGTGKTFFTYNKILKTLSDGKSVTLLVPDQEVMEAEKRIADMAEKNGVFCEKLSVVSFRRLANLAFRKYGGLEYNYLNEGGKLLLIWKIIEELTPVLKIYSKCKDRALTELMLSVCEELKRYSVSPSKLITASENINESHLKDKLDDISLIYSAYIAITSDEFSDPSDDVQRLADVIKDKDFLKGSQVYLDSFNGFTVPELHVIERLLKVCDVTISLSRPKLSGRTGYMTVEKTERDILSLAKKHNIPIDNSVRLREDNAYYPDDFRLIEQRLWDFSFISDENKYSDRITLTECKDRFSEAEYIASKINMLVRNGARYRDIAILSRNTDDYTGILDVVFERYKIPLFFSKRTPIINTALYRTVSYALEIITTGFRTEDILTYIKTGMCGLNISDIDLLESYSSLWGITGQAWTDERDWLMNPKGLNDITTAECAEILTKINTLKNEIIYPIIKLRDSLKNCATVKTACGALYTFICENGIYDKFSTSNSKEDVTIFNTFISVLDTLVSVLGDIPINASMLAQLLYLAAKNTDYGTIPETFDCVVAGDASVLRANGKPHIFLCACENGVFPRSVSDDSFFTDIEKSILSENNVELSPNTKARNDEELFFFLRAACSATESLTATYVSQNGTILPSVGFSRLSALFPALKINSDNLSKLEHIHSLSSLTEIASTSENSALKYVSREILKENGIFLPPHRIPISEADICVDTDTTNKVFGKTLNLTQYRIEDYAKCPFSYYCKYVLRLNEKKHSVFRASDVGTYIHRILEIVISTIFPHDGEYRAFSEKELETLIDNAITQILSVALGQDFEKSGRFSALLIRLRRTVLLITNNLLTEFKNSSFRPKFFEMKIGDNGLSPLSVTLPDGTNIAVYGTIDRVDTFRKDDNVYVRVVDYKTGTHVHSLKNIKLGLDMQMLLYLFSFWKSNNLSLKKALGIPESGQIIPAGVLYHTSRIDVQRTEHPVSETDSLSYAEKKLVRSGILLSETEVLNAMEEGLEGNYIPVTSKKDSLKMTHGELKSLEEFGQLYNDVTDTLIRIGNKIKSGDASARPIEIISDSPCRYCKLHPICRKKTQ